MAKLRPFAHMFLKKVRALRINETKITTEIVLRIVEPTANKKW